jgi:hypothetical protein
VQLIYLPPTLPYILTCSILVLRIWIHWIRISISSESGFGSGSRVLMTKNWKKYRWKIIIYFFKIAIYLSLGLYKWRQSYWRIFQPSKENVQHFKKWNFFAVFYFCGSFLSALIRIRITNSNPDPGTPLNPDPSRIRNTAPSLVKDPLARWICKDWAVINLDKLSMLSIGIVLVPIRIRIRLSILMPIPDPDPDHSSSFTLARNHNFLLIVLHSIAS